MSGYNNVYNIALSFLSGVKDVNVKRLISRFQTAENIFAAKKNDFVKTEGIGEFTAIKIINSMSEAINKAEDELRYMIANDIEVTTIFDNDFPRRLKECDDAPIVLYYKGNPDFNSEKIISIVGTRMATKYGRDICSNFIEGLAQKYPDLVVVSGLAYGIDIAAHKAALDNNLKTWAVMGHSMQTVYPAKHRDVAAQMIEKKGAIISDFPHTNITDPTNFIKRNRIVAGLCDALIVIESGVKGGSIVTANVANHYNKDVFAVPGSIKSVYSEGCNRLIKTNRAHLIETPEDIEYICGWTSETQSNAKKKSAFEKNLKDLTSDEKIIAEILKKYEFLDIDNLQRQSKFDSNRISLVLIEMEFKNIIRALPGKLFAINQF
jgi:DNA processing protein